MSSSPESPNPLRNLLREAESELGRRLHEACEAEARGVASDSAQEIRELEDSLLSAAMAAEQVITARRHLRRNAQDAAGLEPPLAGNSAQSTPEAESESRSAGSDERSTEERGTEERNSAVSTAVREFEDESGKSWRAWPVKPGLARANQATRRSLGEFQEGWICFEALDNSGRRRLPQRGRRWSDLPANELQQLLAEAINVPSRKPRLPDLPGVAGSDTLN